MKVGYQKCDMVWSTRLNKRESLQIVKYAVFGDSNIYSEQQ